MTLSTTSPPRPHPLSSRAADPGARTAALVAGGALVLMAVIAPVAVFGLIPSGRPGVAAALLLGVVALDVLVALALVPVLAPGGRRLALGSAWLRLLFAGLFGLALPALLPPADTVAFERGWDAALLVFGLHLALVGWLLLRLGSRFAGVLVALGGAAYAADAVLSLLGTSWAQATEGVTTTLAVAGELALIGWLLFVAGRR